MRKLYNEFFYIPKHGKVREKVMLTRVVMTVMIVIMCLAAMSITAYAYFSYNITSGSNIIKAANFKADVSIVIADDKNDPVSITEVDSLTYSAELKVGNTYTVTLEPSESTTKTGFCVITAVGCPDTYHTQQFSKNETIKANDPSVTFTLSVSQDTVVSFMSHWGTSSHYSAYQKAEEDDELDKLYITNTDNNTINMVINGVVNLISDTDEEKGITPSKTPSTETTTSEVAYMVQFGDTLSAIAEQYSTTVENIVAYNGLSDANSIVVGRTLKIPPADYEIPVGSTGTTETTTPTVDTTLPSITTIPSETTTGTTETISPTESTTETIGTFETSAPTETTTETTGESKPTTTDKIQPAATSNETASTETTGAPTTAASE